MEPRRRTGQPFGLHCLVLVLASLVSSGCGQRGEGQSTPVTPVPTARASVAVDREMPSPVPADGSAKGPSPASIPSAKPVPPAQEAVMSPVGPPPLPPGLLTPPGSDE